MPRNDVIRFRRGGRPEDGRFDVEKWVTKREGWVFLRTVDQGRQLLDLRQSPPGLTADRFGTAMFDGLGPRAINESNERSQIRPEALSLTASSLKVSVNLSDLSRDVSASIAIATSGIIAAISKIAVNMALTDALICPHCLRVMAFLPTLLATQSTPALNLDARCRAYVTVRYHSHPLYGAIRPKDKGLTSNDQ